MRDYYRTLYLHPSAPPEVVKGAYQALCRIHGQPGGDAKLLAQVVEAHAVLGDEVRRKQHDAEQARVSGRPMIGPYRLIKRIGEGGFGYTYLAEHPILDAQVCIKQCAFPELTPALLEMFQNEARAMWDIRHHALPAVRDFLELPDGTFALVMSYIPGPNLDEAVERGARFDPEHVAWIMQRLLNALLYLYERRIVHGDVKPRNVILDGKGHFCYLVDFGLASIRPKPSDLSRGFTPVFGAPELAGDKPPLPESDLYGLGMTAIFLLNAGNKDLTLAKHIPATVPDPLRRFIQSLVASNALDRPRWENGNLCDEIVAVRTASFGASSSGLRPIAGL